MGVGKGSYTKLINYLDKHDIKFSDKIHSFETNYTLEKIIYGFARMFNPDIVLMYFLAIFIRYSYYEQDYFFVLKPITHTISLLLVSLTLKKLLKRPRPEHRDNVKRQTNLRKFEKHFSMPSGDSIQAGNFAIILFLYFNTYLGFLIVPFVMFARCFYFCHYIGDTIIGAAIGIITSFLIFNIIN